MTCLTALSEFGEPSIGACTAAELATRGTDPANHRTAGQVLPAGVAQYRNGRIAVTV